MSRVRVVLAANGLGLGGTEKGLVTHALTMDRRRYDVSVLGIQELGARADHLRAAGIPVDTAAGDPVRLRELIRGADVVHVSRQGNTEPLLPQAAAAEGVRAMVETNIFGQRDRSADEERFACHLFLSKMCLLRYRDQLGAAGRDPSFHRRHRVLYLPLDVADLRDRAPEPAEAKRLLGLDPSRPVVGRLGRAADLKWRDLLVDMVPHLLSRAPTAQILFVGTTPAKRRRLRRLGVLDRCTLVEPTVDPDELATLYAACDVFVNAAAIGESQGLAIAEAMALAIPVVTCSTPWVDNAQVEFVDNGATGYVANHPRPFAEAVAELLLDDERRTAIGNAATEKIASVLDADRLTRQLEALYDELLGGARAEWDPSPAGVESFAAEYVRRIRAEYRPLTTLERVDARLARARERVALRRAAFMPLLRELRHRYAPSWTRGGPDPSST